MQEWLTKISVARSESGVSSLIVSFFPGSFNESESLGRSLQFEPDLMPMSMCFIDLSPRATCSEIKNGAYPKGPVVPQTSRLKPFD